MASILITGVSSGIGRELALQLVKKNHTVWGVARSIKKLEQLALDAGNPSFFYSFCDVSKPEELTRLKEQMDARGFYPDTLILNAGVTGLLPEVNHNTNYMGVVNAWNAFKMDLQKQHGIVAVSGSLFALVPAPFNVSYSQSKLDALNFLKRLSAEKENANIRFTYFVLGPINTLENQSVPFWKSLLIPSAEKAACHIVNHLGGADLINIFPFSSKAMIFMNWMLPQTAMNRLVTFLKR